MSDQYYVSGLAVFARPPRNPKTGGQPMGFKVCDCSEWVEGAAETIAAALNFIDKVAAMPTGVLHSRALNDLISEAKKIAENDQ